VYVCGELTCGEGKGDESDGTGNGLLADKEKDAEKDEFEDNISDVETETGGGVEVDKVTDAL